MYCAGRRASLFRATRFLPLALLISFAGAATLLAEDSPRTHQKFDNDWRFHLGDIDGASQLEFDDSPWRTIRLPHDWSVEQPFSQDHASGTGYLPGGVGWYRKTFNAPSEWQDREVAIHFDGVYRDSEVWINGQSLGTRPYGYAPFSYRLTPHLKLGEENVIAVKVTRNEVADSRWYPGSGIYRHVSITVTDPTHVDHWGTFVTTPRVTQNRADVLVSNEVTNRRGKDVELRVSTTLVDPSGEPLSEQSSTTTIAGKSNETLAHWHRVDQPQRWSVDTPQLYTAITRIYAGEELIDEVRTRFGIRTFNFHPEQGFYLNGEPMLIKGLCMHHDAGVVGAAVPDKVLEYRLQLAKSLGANAIRCSHNPMADELYSLCDEIGLLVMDEAFDEWELGKRKWVKGRNVGQAKRFGYNKDFEEWAERDIEAMVRRGRNHPSIILWSIGNEIDYPGDPYVHPEFFDPGAPPIDEGSPRTTRLAIVAPRLIAAVKRHDATRPVTMALSNVPASNDIGLANMLDVAGYNYQEQYYQQDHVDFPGRVIYGSENGRSPRSWQAVVENDFISSIYLWVGFDFLGEANEWPNHGSQAGVFDTRGFLKPGSYWLKAAWSEEPMVRCFVSEPPSEGRRRRWMRLSDTPRSWNAEPDASVPLMIVTNCEEVQLKLNGEELDPEMNRFGNFLRTTVDFAPGALQVVGLNNDQEVASDTLRTVGDAARIELHTDAEFLDGSLQGGSPDVALVEIRVVDADGNVVSDADAEVRVEVHGSGRLLGVDNGDQNDTTPLKSPAKTTRDGRLLAIVEHTRGQEPVRVTATADGLAPVELTLSVEQ
ncbi:glycoside hydrolase family 2 TIM barrel-domain containing protein [Aeoliella sp.]|uniref:glycoside hydrolase family 2 TIM barrel-domain containing protein n=1 Tax=Aeoliella sp. TaxID=2795800 RepID=UPI003CCB78D1